MLSACTIIGCYQDVETSMILLLHTWRVYKLCEGAFEYCVNADHHCSCVYHATPFQRRLEWSSILISCECLSSSLSAHITRPMNSPGVILSFYGNSSTMTFRNDIVVFQSLIMSSGVLSMKEDSLHSECKVNLVCSYFSVLLLWPMSLDCCYPNFSFDSMNQGRWIGLACSVNLYISVSMTIKWVMKHLLVALNVVC